MTSGKIELSKKENDRVRVLVSAGENGRTNAEVALALGLSVRQVQRLRKALTEEGPAGLMHGNRGAIPMHALTPGTAARVAHLYKTKYQGFNFSHFTEKLVEVEGIAISRSSVRRVLLSAGYRSPKKHRAPKHRSRRERRASVARDNTVVFGRRLVQIPRGPGGRSYQGCRVEVQHRFDDSLHVYYQGHCIGKTPPADVPPAVIRVLDSHGRSTEECPWANLRAPKPKEEKLSQPTERRPYKPPPNHPWRRDRVTQS
jgi:transposase